MVKIRDGGRPAYNPPIDIVLLCTANQCRSPMAEALLRHHLDLAGVAASVSSAGLLPGGAPATPHAVTAVGERGLDLGGHVSRRIDRELVAGADLLLGMAREHVREVAVVDMAAFPRTFTLKELVAAAERLGPRRPAEPIEDWLARAGAGRRPDALLGVGHDPALDVEDPIGRSLGEFRRTADELDDLLGRLVALGWPLVQERSA